MLIGFEKTFYFDTKAEMLERLKILKDLKINVVDYGACDWYITDADNWVVDCWFITEVVVKKKIGEEYE